MGGEVGTLNGGSAASHMAMAAAAAAAAASGYNPYSLYTTAATTSGVTSHSLSNYYDGHVGGIGSGGYASMTNGALSNMHNNPLTSVTMAGNSINTLNTATVEGNHGGMR